MRVSVPPEVTLALLGRSTRELPERPSGELAYAQIPAPPPLRPQPRDAEHEPSDDVGRVDYDVDFHVT